MELNDVLLWVVGASCVMLVIASLRSSPREMIGWLIAAGIVIVSGAVTYRFDRGHAGYVAGVLWAVLIGLPAIGIRRMRMHVRRHRLDRAANTARFVRLLHPLDGWWHQPTLLHAQHLGERGDLPGAMALLEPLSARHDTVGRNATHHLLRLGRRWDDIIRWVDASGISLLRRDPGLLATYVRALGETGDLPLMIGAFERYRGLLDSPAYAGVRNMVRLHVLAFGGQPAAVVSLVNGPLRELPRAVKQFWVATAEMAAGDVEAGRARLAAALPDASPTERLVMEQRLAQPPADARPLFIVGAEELLRDVDLERRHEERYSGFSSEGGRPILTYLLILACVVMYVVEVRKGGGMNETTLFNLGAAEPDYVLKLHQWWRLLAASFLHFGPVHLGMNMLGLLALGPFVERSLGRWIYLPIYLLSGACGIAGAIALAARHPDQPTILVGASASIMGLVGATGAILLAGWWRERARVARQRLNAVLLIVALQIAFDQMNPIVSGSAHLIGMLGGFVLTFPIVLMRKGEGKTPSP